MDVFQALVSLKQQEKTIAAQIKIAQSEAIAEAEKLGKTGKIGAFSDGSIVFKYVPVKARPTKEIVELQQRLFDVKASLITLNDRQVRELQTEMEILQIKMKALQSNSETVGLEIEIASLIAELPQESVPQISVTLAK